MIRSVAGARLLFTKHPSWVSRQVRFQDSEANLFKWAWIISSQCWGNCVRKLWDVSKQCSYYANRSISPGTWQKSCFLLIHRECIFQALELSSPLPDDTWTWTRNHQTERGFLYGWKATRLETWSVQYLWDWASIFEIIKKMKDKKDKSQWSQWNYLFLNSVGHFKNLPVNVHDLNVWS